MSFRGNCPVCLPEFSGRVGGRPNALTFAFEKELISLVFADAVPPGRSRSLGLYTFYFSLFFKLFFSYRALSRTGKLSDEQDSKGYRPIAVTKCTDAVSMP